MSGIKLLTAQSEHTGTQMPCILDTGSTIWVRQKDGVQDFGKAADFNWTRPDLPTYINVWAVAVKPAEQPTLLTDDPGTPQWDWEHSPVNDIYWVVDEDGETVCDLYHEKNGRFFPFPEAEDRAHMIAQLPNLLELARAHRDVLAWLAKGDEQEGRPLAANEKRAAWFTANNIILRAEGRK